MATRRSTVEHILDRAERAGSVTARAMFGEYGLYCDGKLVGLICDDQLYLKPTEAGRTRLGTVVEASPYPGAKPHLLVGSEAWDDADRLANLIKATADALPAPAPRASKASGRARAR